ncbi:uncharacterized protein LOC135476096 [Liolophura sinensis]|uniref:uncharacterized protein LOC135476096 n=1 Tax=Liolophura sinensis TaxID=3198878 RepID=UPI0031592719
MESTSSHAVPQNEMKDEEQQLIPPKGHLAQNHTQDMGVGTSTNPASETSTCDGDEYLSKVQIGGHKSLGSIGGSLSQCSDADPGRVSECAIPDREPIISSESQSGTSLKETESRKAQPATNKENKDPEESTPRNTETNAKSHSTSTSTNEGIAQPSDTSEVNKLDETSQGSSSQGRIGAEDDKTGTSDILGKKSVEDNASEKASQREGEIPARKRDTADTNTEVADFVCNSSTAQLELETTTPFEGKSSADVVNASENSNNFAVDQNASKSCDAKINTVIGELDTNTAEKVDGNNGKAPWSSGEPMAHGPTNTNISAKPSLITSLAFLRDSQSEEDSEDESTLKIDEDKALEGSETSMNAISEGLDKKQDESSSSICTDKSGGDFGAPDGESDTSRNPQTEDIPQGSDGKNLLPNDSIRLRDLKIKLEKFKEINRTWQRRKPELNSEKSGRSTPTLTRTNIFDALNASLPATSEDSTDTNVPEPGGSKENLINESERDTSASSNNNPEQTNVTDMLEKSPNVSSNHCKQTEATEVHASSGSIIEGDAIVPSDKNIARDNGSTISMVRKELEALTNLLSEEPVQQSIEHAKDSTSKPDPANSVKLTSEADNNCPSATELSQAEPNGSSSTNHGKELVTTSVLASPSADQNCTEHDTAASKGSEKTPSDSAIPSTLSAHEPLEDEEQNMRIAEIFTLHENPEKSTTSAKNSALHMNKENPTVSSKTVGTASNESLLDILNKSADDPSAPLKRTPQKPAEVNWPDFGVKRCQRCSFTTSDDAILQVHTCKRTMGGISASSTEKPSPTTELLRSSQSRLPSVNPETQSQKSSKDGDLSSASPVTRKKIYMPPPSPKVQRGINCRIVRIDKTQYLCTICNYRASYALFIGHLVEHMIEYPYTCPHCTSPGTLYFQRCSDVTAHINTHKSASHKFSMFGYTAAKEFLDRLAKSGAEILSNIWIDPSVKVSEKVSDPAGLLPPVAKPYMTPTTTISQTGTNLSTTKSLTQPVFSSVPIPKSIPTTPVSSLQNFSPSLVSPPATATSCSSTVRGVGPFNVLHQGSVQVQRTVVPTLVQSGPIAGNPLLLLVPSATVGQGAVVQQTATLPNIIPTVSMPNATRHPHNQTVWSTQMQQSLPTNVQQREQPAKSDVASKPSSACEPRAAIQQNSSKSPNIHKKTNNTKGVTVGRIRDNMFCFGCNYKTVSEAEFKNHIWKHLHGNNTHCSHQRGPGDPSSTLYCPFMEKIYAAVPVISSGSMSTTGSQGPSKQKSSSTEGQKDTTSQVEGVSMKSEKKEDNSVNEEDDSDCEIISVGKPKPLCIDLTEDESSSYAEAATEIQKQEGESKLMIQSSYSLNTENSTAVDNKVSLSENVRTNVTNGMGQEVEQQATANEQNATSPKPPQPGGSSQNNAVRDSMFYVCGFSNCKFSGITSEQFKHHLLIHHQGASQYPCAHCGHKNPGEEELFRHMLSHSSAKVFLLYKCGFTKCRFGTNLISEFQQHNDIFHNDAESFTCASCKSNYSSLAALCSHFTASLLKFVQCPYCSVKTKDRRTILQHIGQTHPDKPRQITVTSQLICSSINQEKKMLTEKSHQSPDEAANGPLRKNQKPSVDTPTMTASVDTSDKATSDAPNTSQATLSDRLQEAKNLRCLLCSKVFKSVAELTKHYGSSHKGPHELTIHDCKFCKFSTNDTVHMEKHMADFHPNELMLYKSTKKFIPRKEFKCQVCTYATFCPEELSEHFNSHEVVYVQFETASIDPAALGKISKFTCRICEKNFERYAKLAAHTYNKHPDVKSIQVYKCELCAFLSTALRATFQHCNRAHSGKEKILRFQRVINRASEPKTIPTDSSEHDFSVHWFHCENCSFSSSIREDLLEHLKSHNTADDSAKTSKESPQLEKSTENKESVDVPPEGVLNSSMKCPHCQYSTKVKVNLFRHMKHHKSTDFSSINDNNFNDLPWKTSPVKSVPKNDTSSPNKSKEHSPDAKGKLEQHNDEPKVSPNSLKHGKYDIRPTGSPTKSGQEFYKCRLCSFKASNIQSLSGHLSSHKSTTYQKCSYCPYKCTTKSVMIKHLKKRHKNMPRKYDKATNVLCAETSSPDGKQSAAKRKAHDSTESPAKKLKGNVTDTPAYECVLCGFKTKTINALEEHFKKRHDVKAFVCSRCKFNTLRLLDMEEHLETVHNQKQMLYKMSDVNSSPAKSDGVLSKQHMKCGLCSSITASKPALIEHSLLKHGVDVKPVMSPVQVHKCVDCGRRFRHRQEAKEHNDGCMKRVLKESERTAASEQAKQSTSVETDSNDKIPSPILTGVFPKDESTPVKEKPIHPSSNKNSPKENFNNEDKSNEGLQSLESSHSKDLETPLMCHSTGSREKYKYFCHLCEHSVLSRRRMKEHYFVHFKYYPYKCVYCPKVASRADRLHKHILRIHPGKVLDSKLRKNEQFELKIDRLLKQKRQLLSDVEGNPDDKKEKQLKAEKSSPQGRYSRGSTPLWAKRDYDPSNPFHCEHCNFTTRNKSSLQNHIILHSPPRIKCHICSYTGHFPYLMKRHYERWHPGKEVAFTRIQSEDDTLHNSTPLPAEASLPGYNPLSGLESSRSSPTTSTSGLKRKAGESSPDMDNFKIIADEDSESKILAHLPLQELYEKYQDETGKTAFRCLMCAFCSHTSGLIAAHMYKHMPKCFQCCYCNYRAYPSSSITAHMKRSHEGEPRRFKFFEELALLQYNQMLATIGKLPFEMPKTKKRRISLDINGETSSSDESDSEKSSKFQIPTDSKKWKSCVKEGKFSDTGPIIFCCHLCKFKIPDRGLFGEHLSLHEAFMKPGNQNELAKCGFCSFSSTNVKEFNEHVSTHVSERPFKCLRCGHSCFTKTHMRNHIKNKHPGEKIAYSEKSPERSGLVRKSTPVDSTCVNFEPYVEITDILLLKNAMFDRLVSSSGITAANLEDLSDDKFNAVIKASGFTDEDIYSDIDTNASHGPASSEDHTSM